jgi:acyl dehydratase
MTINPAVIGRTYPPTAPYHVGREKIREFAQSLNDGTPVYQDAEAARALGYPEVIAPPTFPIVLTTPALHQVVHDPDVGIDYSRVVHGEQRFVHTRPVRAGDVLQVEVTIEDVRAAATNHIVIAAAEVRTVDGELVVTAYSTIVARGSAA